MRRADDLYPMDHGMQQYHLDSPRSDQSIRRNSVAFSPPPRHLDSNRSCSAGLESRWNGRMADAAKATKRIVTARELSR